MALQEITCHKSSLLFMGLFKLIEYSKSLNLNLNNIYGKYFNDPYSNWNNIVKTFDWLSTHKYLSMGSMSKDTEQGDGQKMQWMPEINNGTLIHCYRIAKSLNLIKTDVDLFVDFSTDQNIDIHTKLEKWKSLINRYELIKETFLSMYLLAISLTPMYKSNQILTRSPAQLQILNSFLSKMVLTIPQNYQGMGNYDGITSFYKIPYEAILRVFPAEIEILTNTFWKKDLINISNSINVSYDSGYIDYTITQNDLLDQKFSIVLPNKFLHFIYIVKTVPDCPQCFGETTGTLPECKTCTFFKECKNSLKIHPNVIDVYKPNTFLFEKLPLLAADDTIRFKYKTIERL